MQAQSVAGISGILSILLGQLAYGTGIYLFGCGYSLFDSIVRNRDELRELRLSHSEALRILSFSRPVIQAFFRFFNSTVVRGSF